MSNNKPKEVYFDEYCTKCQYKDLPEHKDPCHDCLTRGVNWDTHKPTEFKSAENA